MYDIERAKPRIGNCACCGAPQTILTRFISLGEEPLAVFQAALPEGRHAGRVDVLLSIGEWADGPPSSKIVAFPLVVTGGPNGFRAHLVDADATGWKASWGPCLSRDEAIQHAWLDRVFEVMEAVIREDPPLRTYLHQYSPAPFPCA